MDTKSYPMNVAHRFMTRWWRAANTRSGKISEWPARDISRYRIMATSCPSEAFAFVNSSKLLSISRNSLTTFWIPNHLYVMKNSRRNFIKTTAAATVGAMAFSAQSYARIMGANDRVNVGIVGYSDRFRGSLL